MTSYAKSGACTKQGAKDDIAPKRVRAVRRDKSQTDERITELQEPKGHSVASSRDKRKVEPARESIQLRMTQNCPAANHL